MLCFGCGRDISCCPSDRRRLVSPSSSKVVTMWKAFVMEAETPLLPNVENLLSGNGNPNKAGKMCRKCFAMYERVIQLNASLKNNLCKFLDATTVTEESDHGPSPSKRPCHAGMSTAASFPSFPPLQSTYTSPPVATQVGYKTTKTYVLTPHRKHLGKAVARGSRKKVAIECLKDAATRKFILKEIGREMRVEMKETCSDATQSILRSDNKEDLSTFSWNALNQELRGSAPTLMYMLEECTKTRTKRVNQQAIIGFCAAILLKFRFAKMSLIQKIISILLYHGCASKSVYRRLNPMNVCMSHSSVIRLIDKLGTGHDAAVEKWRDTLKSGLEIPEIVKDTPNIRYLRSGADNSESESNSSESSDSDKSSVTSHSTSTDLSFDGPTMESLSSSSSDDSSIEERTNCSSCTDDPDSNCSPPHRSLATIPRTYRINGDNMDYNVDPRYQRSDNGTKSLHYFQSYAVKDRIDFSHLSSEPPDVSSISKEQLALSVLPSLQDDEAIRNNIIILVARILCDNVPFFQQTYDGVVNRHIKHQYYEQMSSKSEVVPLGILLKNETRGEDMVDIVAHHHHYVPEVEYTAEHLIEATGETVPVTKGVFHYTLFGGDQLTAARIRSAQRHMCNADTPVKRLVGFNAMIEDWHTKLTFLEVIWKYFYSTNSAGEHCTLYQLRNVINRNKVKGKPKKDFNASDDFFTLVVQCHVISAALTYLKMDNIEGAPSDEIIPDASNAWMQSSDDRKTQLYKVSKGIVDEFVDFHYNRHTSQNSSDRSEQYARQIISLGCFYLEFSDAIKEGDGNRILRCWQYLLPIFRGSGRKNYSIEALNLLCQHRYVLSPQLSSQLLWSRTINVHGLPGRNIPGDLEMEHLNRVAKECIHHLGANKTPRAITRVGKAIGTIVPVLNNFDVITSIKALSGSHKPPSFEKDRNIIVNHLLNYKVFKTTPKRFYPSFPKPRDVLHHEHKKKLLSWMVDRLP